jgi:aspartate kinase
MKIYVQKYGGTSVGTPQRIKNVAKRIIKKSGNGVGMVVVVSAMGDTTDKLLELAYEITPNPSDREIDMLLATGEQVSISLLAMAIGALGHPVISLTGGQVGIITDDVHKKARILRVNSKRILEELSKGKIVIVAGFQGITENNEITTLGRGGSDTTAVALAAALNADLCEIYTDVDGVYTADPRIVPEARKLDIISYDEMLEMASLGAKVLHPRSVELAKQYNVNLEVKSSFNENKGTIIKGVTRMEGILRVSGITHDKNIAKVAILGVPDKPGIAYKVFSDLADNNINVDMIIQSIRHEKVNDISFTVGKDELDKTVSIMRKTVEEIGAKGIEYDKNVAKVSVVGAGINKSEVAKAMFQALADEEINIQMISTSEIKISCLIDLQMTERAVKAIHNKFILNGIEIRHQDAI